jgi:hypothetical protein
VTPAPKPRSRHYLDVYSGASGYRCRTTSSHDLRGPDTPRENESGSRPARPRHTSCSPISRLASVDGLIATTASPGGRAFPREQGGVNLDWHRCAPSFAGFACLMPSAATDLPSAEGKALDLGSQDRQVPMQLLGDDGSNSGVVPRELYRQNWSRPSVPGFRFVAQGAVMARLLLWELVGQKGELFGRTCMPGDTAQSSWEQH